MSTVSHVAWVRVSPAPGRNEAVASLNLIADLGIEGDRQLFAVDLSPAVS